MYEDYISFRSLDARIAAPGDICMAAMPDPVSGYRIQTVMILNTDGKHLVNAVPITSRRDRYAEAYDPCTSPDGDRSLIKAEKLKGMGKKYVFCTAGARKICRWRIMGIVVRQAIPPESTLFAIISERVRLIFDPEVRPEQNSLLTQISNNVNKTERRPVTEIHE